MNVDKIYSERQASGETIDWESIAKRRLLIIRELWNLDPDENCPEELAKRVKTECLGQP